jgi:hypothetical protein
MGMEVAHIDTCTVYLTPRTKFASQQAAGKYMIKDIVKWWLHFINTTGIEFSEQTASFVLMGSTMRSEANYWLCEATHCVSSTHATQLG